MGDYAVSAGPGALRIERLLPGPIERVWAYLTESEKRGEWLAAGKMEMRQGGAYEMKFRNSELTPHREEIPEEYKKYEVGEAATVRGVVTRCEPPRLLAYTWSEPAGEPSEVTFELSAQGNGVLLTLTHRRLASHDAILDVAGGWHVHVDILVARLNDREPEPFWSKHERLKAEYVELLPAG